MTHPPGMVQECDWCGDDIHDGPRRHALCRVCSENQQNTPLLLVEAVEMDSMHKAARWLKSVMVYGGRT